MANQLLNPTVITKESLRILKNALSFTAATNTYYADEFGQSGNKVGDTILVRKPNQFAVRRGRVAFIQDVIEDTTAVAVTQQAGVDFQFTSKDLTLTLDRFSERYIAPAIATIANTVDRDGLVMASNATYNSVGTPGTVPTGLTPFANAMARMDQLAVPKDGNRQMIIGPMENASLVDNLKGLFNPTDDISRQYRTGNLASKILGFNWWMDQNTVARTVGPLGGTPLVNGANQTGNSIVTDGWTAVAALRLNQGDVISFAGVYAVNPMSKQSTNTLAQFVVTANVSSDAAGNATIPISPAIVGPGAGTQPVANANVSALPADNAAITVQGAAGTVTNTNLAFHRDAFTLACVPMELPRGMDMVSQQTDPDSGLSIRFVRGFDITADVFVSRLDILYGWAATRPELAVRIAG